jgi:hypothetical protein
MNFFRKEVIKMNNPRTTIIGVCAIGGAILTLVAQYLSTGAIDIHGLSVALTLAGLGGAAVAAKDGNK